MGARKKYTPEEYKNYKELYTENIPSYMVRVIYSRFLVPGVTPNELVNIVLDPKSDIELEFDEDFWETLNFIIERRELLTDSNVFHVVETNAYKYFDKYITIFINNLLKISTTDVNNIGAFSKLEEERETSFIYLMDSFDLLSNNDNYYNTCAEFTLAKINQQDCFDGTLTAIHSTRVPGILLRGKLISEIFKIPEESNMNMIDLAYKFATQQLFESRRLNLGKKDTSIELRLEDAINYLRHLREYIRKLSISRIHGLDEK